MKTATNQSNSHRCETLAIGTSPEMAASSLLVSVLMPCLNEARTLAACIEQAHAGCQTALSRRDSFASSQQSIESVNQSAHEEAACASVGYEILIADNGSHDRSAEIAASHGARVVAVAEPGYGAALQGGILAARGKYVVMGDADCSYDFGEVPRFLEQLEAGHDLVMGNRFSGEIKAGAMPWHHRYIGNPLLSGLGRLLYGARCRDWHCGLRGFDREQVMALGLRCTGMEFASEMVLKSARFGLRVAEIPITLHPDLRDRAPHLRSVRDGLRHLRVLLSHSMSFKSPDSPDAPSLIKKMRTWISVIIALVALSIQPGCGKDSSSDNAAQQEDEHTISASAAPQSTYDFGVLPPGAEHQLTFEIKNGTNETLRPKYLLPSCRCMVPTVTQAAVAPGEMLRVVVDYQAPRFEAEELRHIDIEFEATAYKYKLNIIGRIREPVSYFPKKIQLESLAEEVERFVLLKNYSDVPWINVKSAVTGTLVRGSRVKRIDKTEAEFDGALEAWRVSYVPTGAIVSAESSDDQLQIEITTPEETVELLIPVGLRAQGSIRVFPSTLVFNENDAGEMLSAETLLICQNLPAETDASSFEVLNLPTGFQVSILPSELRDNAYQVLVKARPEDLITSDINELLVRVTKYPSLSVTLPVLPQTEVGQVGLEDEE